PLFWAVTVTQLVGTAAWAWGARTTADSPEATNAPRARGMMRRGTRRRPGSREGGAPSVLMDDSCAARGAAPWRGGYAGMPKQATA
ncbi:hypothetical protein B1C81_33520, partial [Streptomyces sp. HG99]